MGYNKDTSGNPISSSPLWTLGRDSFKRYDNSTEQMNIDGRALGTPVDVWDGDSTYWTESGDGSKTTGSAHSGTYGWDTGVAAVNDDVKFDNGSMIDVDGTYAELRFWIQPKAFPLNSRPKIGWMNSTNNVIGNRVRIDDYTENMDLDVWQQIAIPISDFALESNNVQKLQLRWMNVADQQYWIDDIELIPTGSGPYRFEFEAPDADTIYHVSMIVLQVIGNTTGWASTAFGVIPGGIENGLILRHKRKSDSEVLWKFVSKDNMSLFGLFHPQDDVVFADSKMLVGFMVKPSKASIKVTNNDILQFVVRDDLTDIDSMRAYVHYGVEVIS